MTIEELKDALETTGYPVAIGFFERPPNLPYIVINPQSSSNSSADDMTYGKASDYDVELYTNRRRNAIAEENVEQVLDDKMLFYDSNEDYINTERLYRKTYSLNF